eukprot:TRINITY_DN26881_c0_g2_i1.p1 TRINITY_DN26881_c0_g2~~TRINITY_DN26881_c0_g2_i1.p1  ORF type:complete len:243 (-),score=19.39 TRINITY_DN26881_c0_g2_i1:224-889(-)
MVNLLVHFALATTLGRQLYAVRLGEDLWTASTEAEASGACLCDAEDLRREIKIMESAKNGTNITDQSDLFRFGEVVLDVLNFFVAKTDHMDEAWLHEDFEHEGATNLWRGLKASLVGALLGTNAGLAPLGLALAPLTWSLNTIIKYDKFIKAQMDGLREVPERTAACASTFVAVIDRMIEAMWKMSGGGKKLLLYILDDPGVAQCEWQPTTNWWDRTNARV